MNYSPVQTKKNVLIAGKPENDYTIRSEMDGIVYSLTCFGYTR